MRFPTFCAATCLSLGLAAFAPADDAKKGATKAPAKAG